MSNCIYRASLSDRLRSSGHTNFVSFSLMLVVMVVAFASQGQTASVTLAWDPSSDTNVASYNVYYGPSSGNYTNVVTAGNSTNSTVSGLAIGANYYFVATSVSTGGLESDPSNEINYTPGSASTNLVNMTPTLDPISDLTVANNAGSQLVQLSDISSGAATESQTLVISAISSNPALIPNPTVLYSTPNTAGTLTFGANTNANGVATLTVTVNDGQASNNVIARSFSVTINAPVANTAPTISLIADQTLTKNQSTPVIPFTIGDLESVAANLAISAMSSSTNLVPLSQIVFGGSGVARTVTITPARGKLGTAVIGITVSDGLLQARTSFELTVKGSSNNVTLTTGALTGVIGTTDFQILSITAEPPSGLGVSSATEVTWESVAGAIYHIERNYDLTIPVWADLSGDIVADDLISSWIEGTAALGKPRFYRVARTQ